MKNLEKKKWVKPEVTILSIKTETMAGANLAKQENTNGKNSKRPTPLS